MNVQSLSRYLGNLAAFLQDSGVKKELLDDLSAVVRGFEPFAAADIRQFADFLVRAEEYHRTGVLPLAAGKPARKPATPRAPRAPLVDVVDIAARVKAIYDRATDGDVTADMVEAELAPLDALKKADLLTVAKALDADTGLKSKTAAVILGIIKQAVRDMWGEARRVKM